MEVSVPIVTAEQCKKAYPDRTVDDSMICAGLPAGGLDGCQGNIMNDFFLYIIFLQKIFISFLNFSDTAVNSYFFLKIKCLFEITGKAIFRSSIFDNYEAKKFFGSIYLKSNTK